MAISYKGVVINGNVHNVEKDKREYAGKGKGKVFEEEENKWVKLAERGSKKGAYHRRNFHDEEGSSRSRFAREERTRDYPAEGNAHRTRGQRRERSPLDQEVRDRSEMVQNQGVRDTRPRPVVFDPNQASKEFQIELLKTQAEPIVKGTEVVQVVDKLVEEKQQAQDQARAMPNDEMEVDKNPEMSIKGDQNNLEVALEVVPEEEGEIENKMRNQRWRLEKGRKIALLWKITKAKKQKPKRTMVRKKGRSRG